MGSCCICGKKKGKPTEKTHLLGVKHASTKMRYDEGTLEAISKEVEVKVFKAPRDKINTIPSINDTHSHHKIHASLFINHWIKSIFNQKSDTIPDFIIDIISNYTIKHNISSTIYIPKQIIVDNLYFGINTNDNSISLDQTAFHFDGVYHKQTEKLCNNELKQICNDFLNGYNTSCLCFGPDSVSKNVIYANFMDDKGLLHHCIYHILQNLINCCLFIKIYGIASIDSKEKYVDLLGIASDASMSNQVENKMLLNMDSFNHLMVLFSNNLKQYKSKNANHIIVVFELSLQQIMGDVDVISSKFANVLGPMRCANDNILGRMELQVSTLRFVDIGSVNAITLIEKSPNSKLFRQLSQRIRSKNRSLLNLWDIIKYMAEYKEGCVDETELDVMRKKALLTDKIYEALGGNCRTLVLGICKNDESEKDNLMTMLTLAQNAMRVINRPCINRFCPY